MIITRYILNQLAKVFLGATAVLYCVMFIIELIKIGQIASIKDFDIFFLSLIPMAVFVLPMALMFSVLMILERLSVESEIIAMKGCGVRVRSIAFPILTLALICMIIHLGIATYLGPLSVQKIQTRLMKRAPEKVYAFLQEKEFINTFKDLTLYIESINRKEKTLKNVFIETKGKQHSVIASEKGTITSRPSGILLKLTNGSVFMEGNQSLRFITFDEYNFLLEADFRRQLKIRGADALTQSELNKRIRDENRPPKLVKEYYSRFAFPFLNVILALLGLQFGIQKPRSPRNIGIIVGIGTILSYYLVFLMTDRLVKAEAINPTLGAWIPDTVFLLIILTTWSMRWILRRKGGIRSLQ